MIRPRFSQVSPYLGAVAIVVAAVLFRMAMDPLLRNRQPFAAFIVALILAARYCGFGPSLFALLLSGLASRYFFIPPRGSLAIDGTIEQGSFWFFVSIGLFLTYHMRAEQRAKQESREQSRAAVERQQELERENAERKRIESELRLSHDHAKESETRLLLALDAGRLGYWSWDLTTDLVHSSETQAVINGRSPDQTVTSLEESIAHLHPDDRDLMQDVIERALRNEAPERVTYRVIWPDGSIHWLEAVGQVFCDESGNPQRIIGVCADITERVESTQRFRGIYEQAPLGIALIDSRSGQFLHINPKYEQIIGRTEAEMIQLTITDITFPDDLAEDLNNMDLLLEGSIRRFQMTKRLLRGDGAVIWVNLTVVPMWQAGETPSCHLAMIEDVTEQKLAEEKLRTREAQLSGILDNTSAVIYLKDKEGRYLLTNRRHQDLLQQDGVSILGKTDHEFFPEPIADVFLESDAKVWQEQMPLDFEEVTPHADGLHTYISIKFPVRDETGTMIALGGISTDVSDLKEASDALKKKQDLLRNLIEVQENEKHFLCHEFHDGLIQYAAASLMLLEGYRRNHPCAEDLSIIDTAVNGLRKGVDDGRRVIRGIRPAVLDDSGLEAAIDDLVGQFANSGIMVTGRCDPGIGRLPDPIQTTVFRVVQEALNNAKKYSGSDVVRIELMKSNGDLKLEVRDFGCGFDLGAARKRGFGLLGMIERVRLLGGECQIQSEHDAGTCIAVRLPIPAGEVDE